MADSIAQMIKKRERPSENHELSYRGLIEGRDHPQPIIIKSVGVKSIGQGKDAAIKGKSREAMQNGQKHGPLKPINEQMGRKWAVIFHEYLPRLNFFVTLRGWSQNVNLTLS